MADTDKLKHSASGKPSAPEHTTTPAEKAQEKKKHTFSNTVAGKYVILSILALASAYFALMIFRLNMLPSKYLIAVFGFLLVIWLIFFLIINDKKRKASVNWLFKILALVISAIFFFVSFTGQKGVNVLGTATGVKTQTHSYTTLVMLDSPLQSLSELEGRTVGIVSGHNAAFFDEALPAIEQKAGVEFETLDHDSYLQLTDALYNGEVDAIIIAEAYRAMCEAEHELFSSETRDLDVQHVEEEITVDTMAVENIESQAFNIYISGIDTYGKVSTVARTDANMIVTVNPETKQILLTSIPRDYLVTLSSFGVHDKLTHSGIYGINETVMTVENLFDIDLNYYVRVNFNSVIQIVDALGGIDLYSDHAVNVAHDEIWVHIAEGTNHIDGATALAYARNRMSYLAGDNQRVRNQQAVVAAIINKAMSPAILTNFNTLLGSVDGAFETNMSYDEISSLVKMQLEDMASWNIEQIQVTGQGSQANSTYSMPGLYVYVMEPDIESVEAATQRILDVMNGK